MLLIYICSVALHIGCVAIVTNRKFDACSSQIHIAILLILHRSTESSSGQETSAPPVRGFIGLNIVRRKAVLCCGTYESFRRQRILPSINFSCSGNIRKWTFVARSQTGEGHDQYPLFQLWRPNGTGRYERVYESNSSSGGRFIMSNESGRSIGEYLPHDPVPFYSGYILGLYHPGGYFDSRLSVVHVQVSTGFGRDNYVRWTGTSLSVFNTSAPGVYVGNYNPLVAVNTSEQDVQLCLCRNVVSIYRFTGL